MQTEKKLEKLEKKILRLYCEDKKRTASNLAVKLIEDGIIFKNKELLKKIVEPFGWTIAHELAFAGVIYEEPEILKLKGEDRFGEKGEGPKKDVRGHGGESVAYILANKGHMIKDKECWKLGSERKIRSVAHEMARNGYIFKDKEILSLKDDIGLTPAHEMARLGHQFKDKDILKLESLHGLSVKDFQGSDKEKNEI